MPKKKTLSKLTLIFLILPIIIGIYCLYLGIHDYYYLYVIAKNYPTITATCKEIKTHSNDDGTTYTCQYTYIINDKAYTKTSPLLSSIKPEINSTKTLKYNPKKPEEAIFLNDAEKPFLITFGSIFTLVPLIIILNSYLNTKKKAFNILLGLTITIIGIGTTFTIYLETKTLSLILIIPSLFVIIGTWSLLFTIITPSPKLKQKIEDNETKNNKLAVKIFQHKDLITTISSKLSLIISLIESIIAFIIIFGICIATHAYFFFVPILLLLSLVIIAKILNLLYLKFLSTKPKIAEKINNIAKLFNLRGIVFYFWSSIIFGIFFTYKNNNPLATNIILITIGLILFLIGIFIEIKRRKK